MDITCTQTAFLFRLSSVARTAVSMPAPSQRHHRLCPRAKAALILLYSSCSGFGNDAHSAKSKATLCQHLHPGGFLHWNQRLQYSRMCPFIAPLFMTWGTNLLPWCGQRPQRLSSRSNRSRLFSTVDLWRGHAASSVTPPSLPQGAAAAMELEAAAALVLDGCAGVDIFSPSNSWTYWGTSTATPSSHPCSLSKSALACWQAWLLTDTSKIKTASTFFDLRR